MFEAVLEAVFQAMDSRPDAGREVGRDSAASASDLPADKPKKRTGRRVKPYLLTRNELDGRTGAAKAFDALVAAIENDLGGADQLTSIERSLVEGFVGATITLKNINAKMCLGHEIDVADLSHSISSMVRVASRLGEQRRARDVTARPQTSQSPLRGDLIEAGRASS